MTLEQFRATRRDEADLGGFLGDDGLAGQSGLIYCGGLYIEDTTRWPEQAPGKGKGRWHTLIGNREFQSDDLAYIERPLYEFAISEGIGRRIIESESP